jgi:dihydroorotate dehydrogenase
VIYSALRPLLFRLDPERAHSLSLSLMRVAGAIPPLRATIRAALRSGRSRPVRVFGLDFPNPIGLAAGYDKNGTSWRGLASLGFGHVEIGTVTLAPQPGNPGPRVSRLPGDRSLINRLGFPSDGAVAVAARLGGSRPPGLVLGLNLGKQKETPLERAAEDYERLMAIFAPLADYLVINISSPNTEGLRRLQGREYLDDLLSRTVTRRDALTEEIARRVPLLVKLSPDLDDAELEDALGVVDSRGIDGVIATNTTIRRDEPVSEAAGETWGLSGAALTERSTEIVRRIHDLTSGKLAIVVCGGVMKPDDAKKKLDAGASLVQLFTGLVYEGPGLPGRILRAL